MKTLDRNAVKLHRMTSGDISSTLGIWWADIPENDIKTTEYFTNAGFRRSGTVNYDKSCDA